MFIGNSNVTDCIHVAGTSTCIIYSPNWSNVAVGGHIAADGVTVVIIGGKIDVANLPTSASLLIDPLLTGVGTKLTVSGTTVQPLFSFPFAAITAMELSANFHQEETSTRDAAMRVLGSGFATGFPELGSSFLAGEGAPYSTGQVVLTTNGTASPTSNGGAFADVSVAAASRDSSTFQFQGITVNHTILWCTNRGATVSPLKHWGIELDQVAAGVGGSYMFEIQTSTNNWEAINVMAVSVANQYRYANNVFLRAASNETIRPGIDDTTTWAATTINGTLGQWMRVRIATGLTTTPTFERMRLIPSHTGTNALGQITARGLAQWRSQLFGVGNVWGEVAGGGTADANIAVGSGSAPAGWTQKIKKGLFNSPGDAGSFQFALPDGLCTGFPLTFDLTYSLVGGQPITGAPQVILSVLMLGAGGVLIADSAGGIVPIVRANNLAETFTAKAATSILQPAAVGGPFPVDNRQLKLSFGLVDISDYYEGDGCVMALELDADGTPPQDLIIWTLAVRGVRFTTGGRL